MAGRKTRIETILDDGSKISIVINGNDPKKIMKFMQLLELLNNDSENYYASNNGHDSIYDRIYDLIRYEFGRASFSLTDLYRAYLLKFNEEIKKSTLSTYLSRMVDEGILERMGRRGKYTYRYIESIDIPVNLSRSPGNLL